MTRRTLNFESSRVDPNGSAPLDLSTFKPRDGAGEKATSAEREAIDQASAFPRRELGDETQINIRAPQKVIDAFRKLCKDDRRTYADMLERMIRNYRPSSDSGN
jgi:hypothetical protein